MKSGRRADQSGAASERSASGALLTTVRAVVGLDFVLFGMIFPILPLYARHLGMSVINIGLMLGCYSIAQLLLAPLWGRVADAKGRRAVLIVALFGSAVSAVGLSVAGSGIVLAIAVVINGASGGSMAIAQAAVADITEEDQHAREFGLLGAYVALGFVVGPGLSALGAIGGIRLPFIIAAALGCANLVFAIARFPETLASEAPTPRDIDLSAPSPFRARWLCLVGFGIAILGFSAFESSFALFGQKEHGFGGVGTSLAFVLLGVVLAGVEGRAISPILRRFGAVSTLGFGVVSFSGGLALIGAGRSISVLIVGLVLVAFGYGCVSPVMTAVVVKVARRERRASALGVQQSVSSLARTVGPVLGTGLFTAVGPRPDYYVMGAIMLVAVVPLFSSNFRLWLRLVRDAPRFAEVAP